MSHQLWDLCIVYVLSNVKIVWFTSFDLVMVVHKLTHIPHQAYHPSREVIIRTIYAYFSHTSGTLYAFDLPKGLPVF